MLSYDLPQLAGGRARVVAALDRQAGEAGERLDDDEAIALAVDELHAMRAERR